MTGTFAEGPGDPARGSPAADRTTPVPRGPGGEDLTVPTERPAAGLPTIPGVTLHGEIARGGMGVVYRGRQDFLDRRVAVKLLSLQLQGEQFAARFRREAKILAGIKHQHIVACHSAGTTPEGQSYLVMEFIDGPSLKAWIADNGPMTPQAALRITRACAAALNHARDLGVIHRDVKSENILLEAATSTVIDVTFPYAPKLVDLGLARMTHETADMGLTSPGSVMGTPSTMSPEQFDDPDNVDFRADIYGLGCVLYEMLAAKAAFPSNKLMDLVAMKRRPIGPNPCQVRPEVPAAVGELVSCMLASDRDNRPPSYADLIAQIDEIIARGLANVPLPGARTAPPKAGTAPAAPGKGPNLLVTAELDFLSAELAGRSGPQPTAPAAGGGASGPNLLKTAELDFLSAGLGGGAGATQAQPALPEPSGVFARGTQGPAPTNAPAAGQPPRGTQVQGQAQAAVRPSSTMVMPAGTAGELGGPAAGTQVQVARPSRRPMLLAGAVVLLVAGVAGFVLLNRGEAPVVPPADPGQKRPNRAPTAAEIKVAPGFEKAIPVDKPVRLTALASDPDDEIPKFVWEASGAFAKFSDANGSTTDLTVDALPGDAVEVILRAIDSGGASIEARTTLTVERFEPVDLLDGFFDERSRWKIDAVEEWYPNTEENFVACSAEKTARSCETPLRGQVWRIAGVIESQAQTSGRYSPTGVRLEFGGTAWAILCKRSDAMGAKWDLELKRASRVRGSWQYELRTEAAVSWRDDAEADEEKVLRPFFDVVRRGNTLAIEFGCTEEPAGGGPGSRSVRERGGITKDVTGEAVLVLFATEGGRGVFRELRMW